MQGKQTKKEAIENALNRFLQDEHHLALGFEKGDDGIHHKIFQKNLGQFSLFNPTFGAKGLSICGVYFPRLRKSCYS
jgi:hypothetical protein